MAANAIIKHCMHAAHQRWSQFHDWGVAAHKRIHTYCCTYVCVFVVACRLWQAIRCIATWLLRASYLQPHLVNMCSCCLKICQVSCMYVCTYVYIVLCRCVLHATSIERRIQQAQFQVENIATATAANKLPGCNPSWVAATKCRHR